MVWRAVCWTKFAAWMWLLSRGSLASHWVISSAMRVRLSSICRSRASSPSIFGIAPLSATASAFRSAENASGDWPARAAERITARSARFSTASGTFPAERLAASAGVSAAAIRLSSNMDLASCCDETSLRCASLAANAATRPARPSAASLCAACRMPVGEMSSASFRFCQR